MPASSAPSSASLFVSYAITVVLLFAVTAGAPFLLDGPALYGLWAVALVLALWAARSWNASRARENARLVALAAAAARGESLVGPEPETQALRDVLALVREMNQRLCAAEAAKEQAAGACAAALTQEQAVHAQEREALDKDAVARKSELQAMHLLSLNMGGEAESLGFLANDRVQSALTLREQADFLNTILAEVSEAVAAVKVLADETKDMSQVSLSEAQESDSQVRRALEGFTDVATAAMNLSDILRELNSQADSIGAIIGMINDIADQTNLLALNAAIEAARAGESGRGFAVVADEVRKLAEKTVGSTEQVRAAVTAIRRLADSASESMEATGKRIEECTARSTVAAESIARIMEQAGGMTSRMTRIADATQMLSERTEDITTAQEIVSNEAENSKDGALLSVDAISKLSQKTHTMLQSVKHLRNLHTDMSQYGHDSGQMRGILPNLMMLFVLENYGQDFLDTFMENLGNPDLLPSETFPDALMHHMVEEIRKKSGESARDVYLKFGRFTAAGFQQMYSQYMTSPDFKTFCLNLDNLHIHLTSTMPGIVPPRFSFVDEGDTLHITYDSRRGMFDYFEGILLAAAELFKENVRVTVQRLDAHQAVATVVFAGKST